jgi:hypothetical protein
LTPITSFNAQVIFDSIVHEVRHSPPERHGCLGRDGGVNVRRGDDMNRDVKPIFGEQLRSPEDTAAVLNVSVSWLAKARMRGEGPRFVKIGRVVRYGDGAIQDYIRARTRNSTSEK